MTEYYWLNEDSRIFLERGYLKGETPEERIRDIANTAQGYLGIEGFSDKFVSYMEQGFYSLASPVWSNFGRKRGLPISCNGVYVPDRMDGILSKQSEVGMQTKYGSGTSAYFGDLRARGAKINSGGESSGAVHFMELFDKVAAVVSQGNVRRGSFAAYLPIDHPDLKEFLRIRSEGNSIQEMSFGVTVGDEWMKSMISGDPEKRQVWASIIKKRFETGYPYLFFKDTANNQAPDCYKDKGMEIYASNLCNEISLPSKEDESFVCCLSSLKRHRALGMGVLGWHSYLQSKKISFESMEAKLANSSIFKEIRNKSDKATEELFELLGGPLYAKDYGRRNTTTLAIAPTTSSSFILGQVSPSIEPLNSNYFVKNLAKGKFTYKNPYLKECLAGYGKDNDDVWLGVLKTGGSVQHLSFMSDKDKDIFKTFEEISQKEVVIQAAQRQKYLDQGQSLNIMVAPKSPMKEVNQLMIYAWENGVKGLYYQRSANPSQELSRSLMECKSCEG